MEEKVLGFGVIGTGTYCDHYLRNLGPVYKTCARSAVPI